ncbi:MAG: S-adenosylmethionine synthetase N-terminal domain-containing protein [Sphaerochaeta sp.]|nr:S-adenosylmethionine synthetase N-terminal domain-containing protein [Sphaerochaeta sp.]
MKNKLFSNEIVFRGHPDKVCDQISDAILDQCLCQDRGSRCGVEVVGGKNKIFITGEITTGAKIDIQGIARMVLRDVGYRDDYRIIVDIGMQSQDISLGTSASAGGAGDNGMMFGYATNETEKNASEGHVHSAGLVQGLRRAAQGRQQASPRRESPDHRRIRSGIQAPENQDIDIMLPEHRGPEKAHRCNPCLLGEQYLAWIWIVDARTSNHQPDRPILHRRL